MPCTCTHNGVKNTFVKGFVNLLIVTHMSSYKYLITHACMCLKAGEHDGTGLFSEVASDRIRVMNANYNTEGST